MTIQTATWADMGYRKLGPLPPAGGGLSIEDIESRLTNIGDFEANSEHWVRRHARRKGTPNPQSIEIVQVIDASTHLDESVLKFLQPDSTSEWNKYTDDLQQFRMDAADCTEGVKDFETESNRPRGMYFLSTAISFAAPGHVIPLVRDHCLPSFFRQHPTGKVIGIRFDTKVDSAASLSRSLYALAQAPMPELKCATEGICTLREWHMLSLQNLLPSLLDFFNYLFYPFVGGSRVMLPNLPGICLLFLFGESELHLPGKFPRNWLAIPSSAAVFADESFDVKDFVADYKGPLARRIGHHRLCHESGFNADDRLIFLRWYLGRVNRLLYELTDCANFTFDLDVGNAIEPVFGYEHQITVDRLFRKTVLAMSLDVAPHANLMSFEIADLYDTLSVRLKHTKNDTEFFKLLFNTKEAPRRLQDRFGSLPAPFDSYFTDMAKKAYAKIEETVVASIWRKQKVKASGITVRNKDLTSDVEIAPSDFTSEVMRAYRNAHHGYFSSGDRRNRPSRYLFMVDGNLPVEMSALPIFWWLAYLADAQFVGWKHLGIGAYD